VIDEQRHVIPPRTQGRDAHFNAGEPVVEVWTELTGLDERAQAAIRGSNDSCVHLPRRLAAHALHRHVLQNAQELGLCAWREVGDFVEKEGALVGELEFPAPATDARRRPLFDPEELCFEQALDECRAVDRNEWSARPVTAAVQLARDQLLGGAALTLKRPVVEGGVLTWICRRIWLADLGAAYSSAEPISRSATNFARETGLPCRPDKAPKN
jgi:hypothetical protein